jgi:hypothetical protein
VDAGYQVVVFDNLYQGHREAVPQAATFVQGDLADRSAIAALFDAHPDISAIMHFASYTLVGESMHKPFLYLRDNVSNAANLLEIAIARGVRPLHPLLDREPVRPAGRSAGRAHRRGLSDRPRLAIRREQICHRAHAGLAQPHLRLEVRLSALLQRLRWSARPR